ncbi:hypothetical protein, partial [Serratia marcescens]|uniref:hypothetical protein n=1 Tax=Serratia marcescens TaxID=615 RepID=UPI001C64A70A
LRSDRLIRFSSGDTPNNVEISGCKQEMKGSLENGTGLPRLTLKTAGNRELKPFSLNVQMSSSVCPMGTVNKPTSQSQEA